jgi:hypothetical protein
MSAAASTSSLRRSTRLLEKSPYTKDTTKSTPQQHRSDVKKNKPRRRPPAPPPQTLYLRANRQFLLQFPAATATQPNPPPLQPLPGSTGNLNVIIANLPDLHPFAGNTVDWLIQVARLIFEPLGTSSLYTFTTQTLDYWLDREMQLPQWRVVLPGEQLTATIYEFRPNNNSPISLTKKSLRQMRSQTTDTTAHHATAFRDALLRRDQSCVISQHPMADLLEATEVVPSFDRRGAERLN